MFQKLGRAAFLGLVHGGIHRSDVYDSILEQLGDLLGYMRIMQRRTFLQRMTGLVLAPGSALLGTSELRELLQIDDFKKLFNADGGHVRIVLLLSPS